MLKRCMLLAVMLTSLLAVNVSHAQENWFAYVYNSNFKELVRVNLDGTQTSYPLGLAENAFVSSWNMAFTQDGSRVAYCLVDYSSGAGQNPTRLYVRDIVAQTNLLDLDLGTSMGCNVSQKSFSADGSQLAVSLVNYFPGDPQADTSEPSWQLLVLDAATGTVIQELNANSPIMLGTNILEGMAILPDVRYFANNQIIFAQLPYGTGGMPELAASMWNLTDGTIQNLPNWGLPGLDSLETGELIWLKQDLNLPAGEPAGPVGRFNVLMLADKSGEERIIYHSPDWILLDAVFINNGREIAILIIPPFDPNNPNAVGSTKWIALDRTGATRDLDPEVLFSQLAPAPEGHLYLDTVYRGDFNTDPLYSLTYYGPANFITLWENAPGDGQPNWEIAWTVPTPVAEGLTPFPTFGQ